MLGIDNMFLLSGSLAVGQNRYVLFCKISWHPILHEFYVVNDGKNPQAELIKHNKYLVPTSEEKNIYLPILFRSVITR